MWKVNETDLSMTEGDFGIQLPVTFEGITFGQSDAIRITIKDKKNGTELLVKEFSPVTDNAVNLVFTEAESALLPVGVYAYSLDWFEEGNFRCNIITESKIKVVDKA